MLANIWQYIAAGLSVAFVYVLLVKLGLSFTPIGLDTSPVWPPTGFATAMLLLFGLRFWPVIILGSYIGGVMFSDLSPAGAIIVAGIDSIECIVAVSLLRLFKFQPQIHHVRDMLVLVLSTAFGSCIVAATLGTLVFQLEGQLEWAAFASTWFIYWIANVTANVTLVPFILTSILPLGKLGREMRRRPQFRLEIFAFALALSALIYTVWFDNSQLLGNELSYLLFPFLMWTGLRYGPRTTATAIAAVSLGSIMATATGKGPFAEHETYTALFLAQAYVLVYAITGQIMACVAEERFSAKKQLVEARDNLEFTVAERTKSLAQTSATMEGILDNITSGIIASQADGKLLLINRAARETFGLAEQTFQLDDHVAAFGLYQADGKTLMSDDEVPLARALKGETISNFEMVMRPEGTSPQSLQVSGQPITSGSGEFMGAVIAFNDISARRHQERLQRILHQAAVIANESPDEEQAVMSILEIICNQLQWPIGHALHVETMQGKKVPVSTDWWNFTDSAANPELVQLRSAKHTLEKAGLPERVLSTGSSVWISDVENEPGLEELSKISGPHIQSAVAVPVVARTNVVAILQFFIDHKSAADPDITDTLQFVCAQLGRVYERAEARQALMRNTLRDPLTGMPNRLAFFGFLRQALAHARRRSGYTFSVLFLDLDRFKIINDSLGHAAGDIVLIEVANRIASCLRTGDEMARLGGDEFTVLLDDLGQRSDGANSVRVAQRIIEELARPITIDKEEVIISSSIGIAINSPEYIDPDALLRDADAAMYCAKASGTGRIEIFSSEMHSAAMTQMRLETDLRKALNRNEFVLHYQPIVSLAGGAIIGFEALVRWNHPFQGLLMPGDFLPVAEETGLIVPIGNWVLHEACRLMTSVNAATPSATGPLSVSVNIATAQFSEADLAAQVQNALTENNLQSSQLKLEVVESTLMKNIEQVEAALKPLRDTGVQVLIDDFGTGYSSLSYLAQLSIDGLKIDRSFISSMMENDNSAEIVRCIIGMADALQMDVYAEGIEAPEQVAALKALNCSFGQGFLYSRPMTGEAAIELARSAFIKASRDNL